jgi:hypothetical protein
MRKITIFLFLLCLLRLTCSNPTTYNNENLSADVNISWNPGSRYVYYSVENTGDVVITSFCIKIDATYQQNQSIFTTTRVFGSYDVEILPNETYYHSFDASIPPVSFGSGAISLIKVIFKRYELNTTNWRPL